MSLKPTPPSGIKALLLLLYASLRLVLEFLVSLDTLIWRELNTSGQLLPPRAGHSTVSFGRQLFVFGGFTDSQSLYNDLYMLNVGMFTTAIHNFMFSFCSHYV